MRSPAVGLPARPSYSDLMSTHAGNDRKVTTERLREWKAEGQRIAALTAYDALMAEVLDRSAT